VVSQFEQVSPKIDVMSPRGDIQIKQNGFSKSLRPAFAGMTSRMKLRHCQLTAYFLIGGVRASG